MRSGASTIGRPHCAGCRDIHVCSTPVHQERIILAAHSFDTSVAHTHLKRTTPAHPEPARVETAACPLDGRFHSTDRRRSQGAFSRQAASSPTSVDCGDFQAGLRAGSSSCAKEPQSKHQPLDETLIFSMRFFCTQRRSRAHFDPAARRCRGMRFPGSFCFARGCVPFSDAMSIRYARYIKLTAVICSTYYLRTSNSADATLSNQELPRVASRRQFVDVRRQTPFRG